MTPQRATVADLPKIQNCAEEFYASSRFLEGFDLDRFCALWAELLENDAGVIFFTSEGGYWTGMIGGLVHPDLYSGVLTASEFMWFVRAEHRGHGVRLYRAFESWARSRGCAKIIMVHLLDVMPEKVARFYRGAGFVPIETHFSKSLT